MDLTHLKYPCLQITVPERNSRHICDDEAMKACHFGGKRALERVGVILAKWLVGSGGREGDTGG